MVGIVLIFSFTFLGLVCLLEMSMGEWRTIAAQSIAFQAARSGAQATAITDLRSGVAIVDAAAASRAATSTATALSRATASKGQ